MDSRMVSSGDDRYISDIMEFEFDGADDESIMAMGGTKLSLTVESASRIELVFRFVLSCSPTSTVSSIGMLGFRLCDKTDGLMADPDRLP